MKTDKKRSDYRRCMVPMDRRGSAPEKRLRAEPREAKKSFRPAERRSPGAKIKRKGFTHFEK